MILELLKIVDYELAVPMLITTLVGRAIETDLEEMLEETPITSQYIG